MIAPKGPLSPTQIRIDFVARELRYVFRPEHVTPAGKAVPCGKWRDGSHSLADTQDKAGKLFGELVCVVS